jgi:hypothetical protein
VLEDIEAGILPLNLFVKYLILYLKAAVLSAIISDACLRARLSLCSVLGHLRSFIKHRLHFTSNRFSVVENIFQSFCAKDVVASKSLAELL